MPTRLDLPWTRGHCDSPAAGTDAESPSSSLHYITLTKSLTFWPSIRLWLHNFYLFQAKKLKCLSNLLRQILVRNIACFSQLRRNDIDSVNIHMDTGILTVVEQFWISEISPLKWKLFWNDALMTIKFIRRCSWRGALFRRLIQIVVGKGISIRKDCARSKSLKSSLSVIKQLFSCVLVRPNEEGFNYNYQ